MPKAVKYRKRVFQGFEHTAWSQKVYRACPFSYIEEAPPSLILSVHLGCSKEFHPSCALMHKLAFACVETPQDPEALTKGLEGGAEGVIEAPPPPPDRFRVFCERHGTPCVYCVCRKPYDEEGQLIECGTCKVMRVEGGRVLEVQEEEGDAKAWPSQKSTCTGLVPWRVHGCGHIPVRRHGARLPVSVVSGPVLSLLPCLLRAIPVGVVPWRLSLLLSLSPLAYHLPSILFFLLVFLVLPRFLLPPLLSFHLPLLVPFLCPFLRPFLRPFLCPFLRPFLLSCMASMRP